MLDIFSGIREWVTANKQFALATVTSTWGSGPRKIGEAMAISEDGKTLGSVSGGCVEDQVVELAMEVIRSGRPARSQYGITHEEAWDVGLSCGGKLGIMVEPFFGHEKDGQGSLIWKSLQHQFEENLGGVLLTRMDEEKDRHTFIKPDGELVGAPLQGELREKALQAYSERSNQLLEEEGIYYFAKIIPRKSELIIIGAAHMATDLVQLGNMFDFKTIVIEPRGFFSEKADFPDPPHELYEKWPLEVLPGFVFDQYSYAVTLSHDPKIDDQALQILLNSEVGYIGSLGSRRTHEKRKTRLANAGFSEEQINRIHGPIGVDINAKSAKEIALSIMSEIIGVKNQYL